MSRSIASLIVLLRDELLIRLDQPSEVYSSGISVAGKPYEIFKPEIAKGPSGVTAIILATGPDTTKIYSPGLRIGIVRHAGTGVGLVGIEHEEGVKVIRPEQVLMLLPGTTENALLDPANFERTIPPPRHLFAERQEMPLRLGRFEPPPGYREHTRSAEAVIRQVAPDIENPLVKAGDYVLLAPSVTRWIGFGAREEREIWVLTEPQILCKLREEPAEGEAAVNEGESPFEDWSGPVGEKFDDKIPEGDPRGLR